MYVSVVTILTLCKKPKYIDLKLSMMIIKYIYIYDGLRSCTKAVQCEISQGFILRRLLFIIITTSL